LNRCDNTRNIHSFPTRRSSDLNSAGKPILGQIEKYDLTNVLVAVVRYFGGTKLGVGGLIDAYRTAAQLAIDNATIVEKQLLAHLDRKSTRLNSSHVKISYAVFC